jgi:Na+/H+-dicarboxylate symporter
LKKKEYVILFVNDIFALLLKMASMIMCLMPLAITSFIILFYQDLKLGMNIKNLYLYILCIVGANIVQAVIVLPLLLLYKKINPWALFRTMTPALTLAFFSKSSAATLPLAIKCSERFPMRPKIASFTFSICSTINMNACAGFILITVLFNSELYGLDFSVYSYMSWIFIATIAAIGNAAVPMGCYFLASSFLASQNIPLKIMGVILPVYSILDMLETAINIWSDSCVSAIVNKETSHEYS